MTVLLPGASTVTMKQIFGFTFHRFISKTTGKNCTIYFGDGCE